MKQWVYLLGTFCGISAVGCSVQPAATANGGGDAGATVMAMPDLRIPRDFAHDMTPPPSVAVTGIAVDEMGVPIADAFMSVCNPLGCHSVNANESGGFIIPGIPVMNFGVRSHDDDSVSPVRGTVVRLFHPTVAGVVFDAGKMYVPSMPAGAALSGPVDAPQTLSPGDGLTITFVQKDLDFPIGENKGRIATRLIPPDHVPPYDLGGEQIIAAYAFLPYSTTSKSPVSVTAPIALPAGTVVHFRSVYEFDGRVSTPVTGHAANDGKSVSTDPGTGLDNLTWLVISR